MKKIISIIMVTVMLCSFTVFASAANEEMQIGKTYTEIVGTDAKTFTFTPDSDAIYEISAKLLSDENTAAAVSVSSDENLFGYVELLSTGEEDLDYLDGADIFPAKKGIKLSVEILNTFDNEFGDMSDEYRSDSAIPDAKVEICIKKSNIQKRDIGEVFTYSDEHSGLFDNCFYIIPQETMQYNFWSHPDGTLIVMDGFGNINTCDYSPVETLDYTQILEKGEIYLVIPYLTLDESKPTADINIVDGSGILPEVIELDDILMINGEESLFEVAVYPLGSRYNYETLELTMGNSRIASAEYDKESGSIMVRGHKLGKTTLTVTEPISGATAEVEVKVVSRIGYFFITIYKAILEFLFG